MNKQISLNWTAFLLIAVLIFMSSAFVARAQDVPKFKVGDRVKNPDHDAPATIVKVQPGWLTVKYDDINGEYEIMSSGNIILLGADGKPLIGNKAAPQNKTKETNAETETGGDDFKVGDRVKVTISGLQGDDHLQPCTITGGLKNNQYQVRCDPWNKLSYMDYNVLPEWVHSWTNAAAAPTFDCSFDTPAGTVLTTAAASAPLFKRVIYEQMAAIEKARMGLQFTTFQMGTPFRNVMTGNGLLKSFVPENAMFYPVKTQFITCREGSLDFNHRQTIKENFGCYKDRFGDWVCGTDGVPEFSDDQEVPKKNND